MSPVLLFLRQAQAISWWTHRPLRYWLISVHFVSHKLPHKLPTPSSDIKPKTNLPGAFGIPCDKISTLAAKIDITFTSKSFNLTIPTEELSVGPFADEPSLCQTLINGVEGLNIVGSSALKHFYSLWRRSTTSGFGTQWYVFVQGLLAVNWLIVWPRPLNIGNVEISIGASDRSTSDFVLLNRPSTMNENTLTAFISKEHSIEIL